MTKNSQHFEDAIVEERLNQLEETMQAVCMDMNNLTKAIHDLNKNLRETQEFAVKVAVNQRHLNDRIMKWPFIKPEGREID
jgi:DNA-binding MltR family transcriptional regulator